MMAETSAELFSACYPLYVSGMRESFKERLSDELGSDWFELGVLPALTDSQRDNLLKLRSREPQPVETYLDAAHFGRVLYRNHSTAFADALPNLPRVMHDLNVTRTLRHLWAHALPFTATDANAAVRSMLNVLIPLGRREAIEISARLNHGELGQSGAQQMSATEETEMTNIRSSDDEMGAPLSLWRELQSYLVLDFTVVASDQIRGGEQMQTGSCPVKWCKSITLVL
ncbi:MAG: Swt1 family HEPN domain-containing protein [Chloroflexi bacterium]|nr:Swt1 family HEPN domain-containing protein [Chloroflexota bacterium]MDA1173508.1 Swt1 family HEPN domain-containing protein [Chloroflexota bacterium]